MKKPIINIVFNIPGDTGSAAFGTEADADTWDSVDELQTVLIHGEYKVNLIPLRRNNLGVIRRIKSGVIFNLIEWTGKDIVYTKKAMELIEMTGLPYTGTNFEGLFLSTNKVLMKKEFDRLGIPTPRYQIFKTGKEAVRDDFIYPVLVKPAYEHCGIGVSQDGVLDNETDLAVMIGKYIKTYKQPILAEEYIDGREINVTILENRLKPWVLDPVEVVFNPAEGNRPIFTYEAKWRDDLNEFERVSVRLAELSSGIKKQISRIAERVYTNMGGGDYPRLDIRIREEEILVLEVNTNPEIDFTVQGGLGISVKAAGMSYLQFLEHLISNVIYRFESLGYEPARM